MGTIVLRGSIIVGLIVSSHGIASASPATHLFGQGTPVAATGIEHIDYNWNHHHYHHRSWDKQHARWRYYN
jgi:hypothetical protein